MLTYYTDKEPEKIRADTAAAEQFMSEMEKFSIEGPDKPFLDVLFENETHGFIVGAFNMIFHTTDGGVSWEPWYDRTDNPKRLHLYSIRSIDGDIFIGGEQGLLLKLDRKASRFSQIKSPYQGTFFGITGKRGVVIAFGLRGNIFRSEDKGSSWKKIDTGLDASLTGATVTEDGQVIVVSQAGNVLLGKGDCSKFNEAKIGAPFPATAVAAVGSDTVVVAGFGGLRVLNLK
jgi:photosystem II stability/assembly factor-like uncharacterized protein